MKITTQLKLTVAGLASFAVGTTIWASQNTQKAALDASSLDWSGLVRGATQRLIKLETNGQPNDELRQNIDRLIQSLIDGDKELNLPKASDTKYLEKIQITEEAWQQLKTSIAQYRQNPNLKAKLIEDSETFFTLTDEAVSAAEEFSAADITQIQRTHWAILVLNLGVLAFVFWTIQQATKVLQQSVITVADSSSEIAATVEMQERLVADQTSSVNVTWRVIL